MLLTPNILVTDLQKRLLVKHANLTINIYIPQYYNVAVYLLISLTAILRVGIKGNNKKIMLKNAWKNISQ